MQPDDVPMNPAWWCLVCGDSHTERCQCGALCIFQGTAATSEDPPQHWSEASRGLNTGIHHGVHPFSISESFHLPPTNGDFS